MRKFKIEFRIFVVVAVIWCVITLLLILFATNLPMRDDYRSPLLSMDTFSNRGPVIVSKNNTLSASHHEYPDYTAPAVLPKILALYFPQYHRDPLNDRLWGDGFTDWVNVKEAPETNRKGYKIMRPADFGYYDLTNQTIRKMQSDLAREYSLDGFVYHHYWFYDDSHSGPNLHAPLMMMLEDGYPDLPFCLHWVAYNWTANWNRDTQTENEKVRRDRILQQQYLPTDPTDPRITAHFQWLSQFFHHKNYICVDGKPVLMIYRHVEGISVALKRLQELAIQDGFPGLVFTVGEYATHDVLFPLGREQGDRLVVNSTNSEAAIYDRITNYPFPYDWTRRETMHAPQWCLDKRDPGEPRSDNLIGLVTSFDNTPRRDFDKARIWISKKGEQGLKQNFRRNLWAAVFYHSCCYQEGGKDQFILINAWNEWAEGMALEPSSTYGVYFLERIRAMKDRFVTCEHSFV